MTIKDLKRRLERSIERVQSRPPVIGQAPLMAQAVKTLEAKYGASYGDAKALDRIHRGLEVLYKEGIQAAVAHLRYICWGLTHPIGKECLLAHPRFPTILEIIREEFQAKALSLNAWRGLLEGYFSAEIIDTESTLFQNWLALRTFLADTLEERRKQSPYHPSWLRVITDHKTLLGDGPCDRYGVYLLKGQREILDELRQELSIPEQSWFWRETVLSRARSLCQQDQEQFLRHLPDVLSDLAPHPTLANEALVMLLSRYHEMTPATPHQALQNYAVEHWGSPNIFAQAKWAQVPPDVKEMVQAWLVRDDLQTFFEILQVDRTVDKNRFDFWLRYHHQMDFVRIALGPAAWKSTHPDFQQLRKHRRDRVCSLEGAPANLNAIIMKLGNHVFVEFSHTGNAAYGYARKDLPFTLEASQVARASLSSQGSACFRESHSPRDGWHVKFAAALSLLGIVSDESRKPQHETRRPRPAVKPVAPAQPPAAIHAPMPPKKPEPFNEGRFKELCAQHKLQFDDNRAKKGVLWVRTQRQDDIIAIPLKAMGFQFSNGNGWWRR